MTKENPHLAQQAYDYFMRRFAASWNRGIAPTVHPQAEMAPDRIEELKFLDHLESKSLIKTVQGARFSYTLTDLGKRLTLRSREVQRHLGLPSEPPLSSTGSPAVNPVHGRARELFEEHFRSSRLGDVRIPHDELDIEACRYLVRKDVLREAQGGGYALSELGEEIRLNETSFEAALTAKSGNIAANFFYGPVAAVATAPGAVAHGTIHIQAVDQALHQLVEQQDALGELTELLFPLLRRVRQGGIRGTSEDELQREIAEAEEFKAFQTAVKSSPPSTAITTAKHLIGAVGVLKPLLEAFS